MNKIQNCKMWLRAHEDLFIDMVRIYLGCGLIVKAVFYMNHRDLLNSMITDVNLGWIAGSTIAFYIILAHLVGGAMLALGLLTRIAAFAQLPILMGAVFGLYLPRFANIEPRQYLEYAGLVTFLLMLFGLFGAGRFSFDYMMLRKMRELRELKGSEARMAATGDVH